MYTFMTGDNHKCKKAKGVNKNAVDDERNYEDYKNVWFIWFYMRHKMNWISCKDQNVRSYRINKTSLSCYDDKKYIVEDRYSRLSHFYFFFFFFNTMEKGKAKNYSQVNKDKLKQTWKIKICQTQIGKEKNSI